MALTVDRCRYNRAEISFPIRVSCFTELFTKVKGKLMWLASLLVLKRVLWCEIEQQELAFNQFL